MNDRLIPSLAHLEMPNSDGAAHLLDLPHVFVKYLLGLAPEGLASCFGFVMTAEEVNPVIRALRQNGIEVVSLHNHGLDDEPRLFYMHFWANDGAATLAQGLRQALDQTNSATG
jgi:hypothetical protein